MTETEILTAADVDAMLADSVDVADIDDSLRGVLARNREVFAGLARYADNLGAVAIPAYTFGYGDLDALERAGYVAMVHGASYHRLADNGIALVRSLAA